jgi:hypothetical protein
VAAFRGDPSAVEDENAIRITHRREPVSDDDGRAARTQPPQRRKDNLFGNGIER